MKEQFFLRNRGIRSSYILLKHRFQNSIYKSYTEQYNCIFIHIPKAAGKSISQTLFGNDKLGHFFLEDYYLCDHRKAENAFKFGFVRNPIDRFYSAYNFLISGQSPSVGDLMFAKRLKMFANIDHFVQTEGANILNMWIHFVPQYEFLVVNDKIKVDYVGKFESLNHDFDFIQSKLGINKKLLRINSARGVNNPVMENKTVRILKELYKKDFQYFSY